MTEILLIAPRFDDATQYSYLWMQRLLEKVEKKVEAVKLFETHATREHVLFETGGKDAVVFYDHGSEDCLYAQGGQECVFTSSDAHLFRGRLLYTMACLAARKLGATVYANGGRFIGYYEPFSFVVNEEERFCRAANSGFIAWAEGERDFARIKQTMVDAFNAEIDSTQDAWAKVWLRYDRDALRVYAPGVDTPSSTCPFRSILIKIFGPTNGWRISNPFSKCGVKRLAERILKRDIWHMALGFAAGLLRKTVLGAIVFTVYLLYQLLEKEPTYETVKDLCYFLTTAFLAGVML
ncbi:MAG: hypothetical protein QW491_09405 [Thermoproteota archaeon]